MGICLVFITSSSYVLILLTSSLYTNIHFFRTIIAFPKKMGKTSRQWDSCMVLNKLMNVIITVTLAIHLKMSWESLVSGFFIDERVVYHIFDTFVCVIAMGEIIVAFPSKEKGWLPFQKRTSVIFVFYSSTLNNSSQTGCSQKSVTYTGIYYINLWVGVL